VQLQMPWLTIFIRFCLVWVLPILIFVCVLMYFIKKIPYEAHFEVTRKDNSFQTDLTVTGNQWQELVIRGTDIAKVKKSLRRQFLIMRFPGRIKTLSGDKVGIRSIKMGEVVKLWDGRDKEKYEVKLINLRRKK